MTKYGVRIERTMVPFDEISETTSHVAEDPLIAENGQFIVWSSTEYPKSYIEPGDLVPTVDRKYLDVVRTDCPEIEQYGFKCISGNMWQKIDSQQRGINE